MSPPYNEDLFRKQAIESLSRRTPGRPICLVPRPWAWLSLLVVLLFVSAAVLAGSAEYSRKESVRGWLISTAGVVRVTARATAVIRDVVRHAGDPVVEGEPLVLLSTDMTLVGGDSISEEILAQLHQEVIEVDRQTQLSKQQQQFEETSSRQQMASFDVGVVALAARLDDQSRRLGLSAEKLRRLEAALTDGAVTQWDVLKQKQEKEVTAQEYRRLQQDVANQQRERELLKGRAKRLVTQAEILRSTLRAQRRQVLQRIAEQEAQRLSVMTSPITGVVGSVEVHAGNSVAPQQLLVTVVPQNADLIAEVFVPSRAAGFIRPGQSVRIAYDAFPQQKFGSFEGTISRISASVLLPGDIPRTFSIREATYKIHIELTSSSIDTSIGVVELRPGMLLAADIILERRNLIDWLLEPLRLRRSAAH